jgi:hypothetical protein
MAPTCGAGTHPGNGGGPKEQETIVRGWSSDSDSPRISEQQLSGGDGGQVHYLVLVDEGNKQAAEWARTWKEENPGVHWVTEVETGQDALYAMETFARAFGKIDKLIYFGHGDSMGTGLGMYGGEGMGSLYTDEVYDMALSCNDQGFEWLHPEQAAKISDIKESWFSEFASIELHACDVGDTFAPALASHLNRAVWAPTAGISSTNTPYGKPFAPIVSGRPQYPTVTSPSKGSYQWF